MLLALPLYLLLHIPLNSWFDRLNQVLDKAEWHYVTKSYDLPYEYAKGIVVL